MLNGLNEWTTQIAKGVNSLNEWGQEKAKAINGIHEWTSSIAKNLNHSVNWTEDMFGRAISKEDAMKLVEYIELVAESKQNPELKNKIEEMLKTHSITAKPLNEASLKGIAIITADTLKKVPIPKTDTSNKSKSDVEFDGKIIVAKMKDVKVGKGKLLVGNTKLQMDPDKSGASLPKDDDCCNDPKNLKTGLKITQSIKVAKDNSPSGPTKTALKDQNMKLNVKPGGKGLTNENLNKTLDIQTRKTNLDDKLSKIIETLEKEKGLDETVKNQFPFTQLLSETDRKRFANLDATDKTKVAQEVEKVPTTDSKVIVKLWENAIATDKVNEPLWLKLAPKAYKEAYKTAPESVKENINARAEFYTLNTEYQIENFWETSGVVAKPTITLNESMVAKTPEETEQKLDSFVAAVGEGMKRFNF